MVSTSLVRVLTSLVMVSTSLLMVSTSLVMVSTFLVMVGTPEALLGGHQRRLLHRNVQGQWKLKSITNHPTDGPTDQRTDLGTTHWVGARDTCMSKKVGSIRDALFLTKANASGHF